MELRTLRYFAQVAEAGTVSAAAEALHVTQPGLSRQLRQLERDLGVALFERSAGRLSLSAAGRALLPRVHQILGDAEQLGLAAKVLSTGRLDRITLAAPATTLAEVVAPFIATLAHTDPTPSAFACDGYEARSALRAGADLVITNGRPVDAMDSMAIGVLPVWAYLPKAHRWAAKKEITLTALKVETIISLPTAFSARQAFDAAVQHTHQAVSVDIEASSGAVAQALAAAGRGIAIVTDDPRFDLARTRIRAGGGLMNIHLFAGWDPDHPAHSTLAAIARRLARHVDHHYGSPA